MAGKRNQRATELNVGVAYQGVGFGDKTARIGVQIVRDYLELDKADELFCDRRLHGIIVLGHADDDPKQKLIIDEIEHAISAVFDVKGYRVTAEIISIGLTFAKAEIPVGELERFAKSSGRLIVTKSEDIPIEAPAAKPANTPLIDDDEADEEDDPETADFEDVEASPEGAGV